MHIAEVVDQALQLAPCAHDGNHDGRAIRVAQIAIRSAICSFARNSWSARMSWPNCGYGAEHCTKRVYADLHYSNSVASVALLAGRRT